MSRAFNKISNTVWGSSRKFAKLRGNPTAMLVYLYLLTNDRANSLGAYVMNHAHIQIDTGLSEVDIIGALEAISDAGLIEWDREEHVFRIMGWLRINPISNPKHAKGTIRRLEALPASKSHPAMKAQLLQEIRRNSKYVSGDLFDRAIIDD